MLRHVQHAVDGTFFDRWLSYVRLTHQGQGGQGQEAWAAAVAAEGKEGGGEGAGGGTEGQAAAARSGLLEAQKRFMACACRGSEEEEGCEKGKERGNCRMCGWVGRCPRESKLEPREFEAAVKAIARDASLGMADKSRAVQMLRSCAWSQNTQEQQGQGGQAGAGKRPRPSPVPGEGGDVGVGAPLPSQPRLLPAVGAGLTAEVPAAVAPGKEDEEGGGGGRRATAATQQKEQAVPPVTNGAAAAAGAEWEAERVCVTYTPSGELGCKHYRRACTLRAECCGRFYTCRLCHGVYMRVHLRTCSCVHRHACAYTCSVRWTAWQHHTDEAVSDHAMDRYAVREVQCMRCGEIQPAAQYCRSEACRAAGRPLSAYYCGICRLYDDDAGKAIYHCPYCNVCRLGKGLGIDFRHCMTCNACVSLSVAPEAHKCIEQALQRDCPVCNEPLFTSTTHYKVPYYVCTWLDGWVGI